MTTPKRVSRFPKRYLEIAEQLRDDPGKRIVIEFETFGKAQAFRSNIHAFRTVARAEGLLEMFPEVDAMFVQVEKEPPRAIVMHLDYTDEALAIKKALKGMQDDKG